jgi:hypothetical protein
VTLTRCQSPRCAAIDLAEFQANDWQVSRRTETARRP